MNEPNDQAAWFKGGSARCSALAANQKHLFRLALLGGPGAGKGTQAELLCARFGLCHLSTGDVFRAAKLAAPSELDPQLSKARDYMRQGKLMPDDTVLELVRQRSQCLQCLIGFVLDGFPRTVAQAEALQQMLQDANQTLTAAIHLALSSEQIMARLSGRRTCPGCKTTFHVVMKPSRVSGRCDRCGAKLIQREDDQPESIKVRIQEHERSSLPLLRFYRERGLLISIDAGGSPAETCERAAAALATVHA